ncbi:MAG: hypothetical protein E3K32_06365 [wastewater metagenome]|nr:hypothetical protein [Candidatus Loosdrechtia aerotolerans]
MHRKNVLLLCIVTTISLLFSVQEKIYSADAYFNPGNIREQIVRAIKESKESIDIAVTNVTSRDILHSLIQAQERGVHIRIVVDRKRALKKEPLLSLYKNKKLITRVLIQKGVMHSNFAIFDSLLLTTGSYCWSENVSKFNHDNAIFTDETRIVVKYQKEFDRLFSKAITPDIPETHLSSEKNTEHRLSATPQKSQSVGGEQIVASGFGVDITGTTDNSINMNFEEFNRIFGVASELSDEQRESLWHRCTDKKVTWSGRVDYIGWGIVTGWMMGINHGDTSVEVKLNPANKERFSKVKYGNTVTYTGKLDTRVTKIFPYKLEDGDILEIKDTPPKTLSSDKLTQSPDVVPISQGPKKIFIVESFEDIDAIFSNKSKLTDSEKEEAWKKYQGKYVSWIGQIVYKNLSVASGLRIGIKQKEDKYIELKVSLSKKNKMLKLQDNETIHYTGKLTEWCKGNSPYVLEDGDIIILK